MVDYHRQVLALDDKALERFTRDWVSLKAAEYDAVERFGGAQDLGRDVVGFLTPKRHEAEWHNYQCKQFTGRRLPLADGLRELGKVLYYASQGEFTAPSKYFFVAPHGVSRPLEKLLDSPTALEAKLQSEWDQYCASTIVKGKIIPFDAKLAEVFAKFSFPDVRRISLEEMLSAPNANLVLHKHCGADPGPAPGGVVPAQVQPNELQYLTALVEAYAERDGASYAMHSALPEASPHLQHLTRQRERFFDADSFMRFYRDNTSADTLHRLERDVQHGVLDVHSQDYRDSLTRVDKVMAQAAAIQPGGPLAPHAGVTVKQGYCHHLVNDGKLSWRKK